MILTKEAKETKELQEENQRKKNNVNGYTIQDTNDREVNSSLELTILQWTILLGIGILAFTVRLFSVVRWESIIHEFDPYFNYRTTKLLASDGTLAFLNWFDDRSWYPLGRIIGGTIYPGLMYSAACLYWVLNYFNITINIRNVCVFLAPIFAANTSIVTFFFTRNATKRPGAGLLAAAFIALVPSYISRSVSGSFDNEGVAIFALILTFYCWTKSITTGSMLTSLLCSLSYFYMVSSWGGFVFIINIIPLHILFILLSSRYSSKTYIAYSIFYVMGSLLAMQISFVGFNVIKKAECALSHGVFIVLQAYAFGSWCKSFNLSFIDQKVVQKLIFICAGLIFSILIILQLLGKLEWTGRSLTLLDPTYASKYIPIIASVSEHQPTTWSSFFFDLHLVVVLCPIGLYFLYETMNDHVSLLIIYGTISWYFAGVMNRLMLVLAPIACVLASVGLSTFLTKYMGIIKCKDIEVTDNSELENDEDWISEVKRLSLNSLLRNTSKENRKPLSCFKYYFVAFVIFFLVSYLRHCTVLAAMVYSSPSIIFEGGKNQDGEKIIYDDLREAFFWLRQNTDESAIIMSWWDYGYQMSSMANRTNLVDNNTWNNTHIATVGRAFASSEKQATTILHSLDVDYVVIMFGGLCGHRGDDLNKFSWFIKIAAGVYPQIKEEDFLVNRQFLVSSNSSDAMKASLLYKLSFYRFANASKVGNDTTGNDLVRGTKITDEIVLNHFEEVYTSENWIVRIFRLPKQLENLVSVDIQDNND